MNGVIIMNRAELNFKKIIYPLTKSLLKKVVHFNIQTFYNLIKAEEDINFNVENYLYKNVIVVVQEL